MIRVGVVVGAKIEDVVLYRGGEGASVTSSVEAEVSFKTWKMFKDN